MHHPADMLMPPISRYMTPQPWTVAPGAKLSDARQIMREHHIRHLPVTEDGRLVGIISQRDVTLFERSSTGEDVSVEEAMTADVCVAGCDDPADAIVERMSERKCGSVVVLDRRGGVQGIFTSVDGLQMLADVLRRATA